jgi:hypothetical protein
MILLKAEPVHLKNSAFIDGQINLKKTKYHSNIYDRRTVKIDYLIRKM